MKKLNSLLIVIGLLCFAGIIYITAKSEGISDSLGTIGFIVLGYLGIILFSYGWLKRTKDKKTEDN